MISTKLGIIKLGLLMSQAMREKTKQMMRRTPSNVRYSGRRRLEPYNSPIDRPVKAIKPPPKKSPRTLKISNIKNEEAISYFYLRMAVAFSTEQQQHLFI